jgi:hypothetical protein
MADRQGTIFRWIVPIQKALPDADDGSILHAGICSDESADLQDERIPQQLVRKSYAVLERYGKFNWDHGAEDIGDVLGIRQIDQAEAMDRFGIAIEKSATAVWGNVYPLVDPSIAPQDLKTAHHRLRANARLGYSLDGIAVRKSTGEIERMLLTRVAITPQPINQNTFAAPITKSLSSVASSIGLSDEPLPEMLGELPGPPDIILDGSLADGLTGLRRDRILLSATLVDALVRAAFGSRNAPPLGGLASAIKGLRKTRRFSDVLKEASL